MDPLSSLIDHVKDKKVLNITNQMLTYCPHSLLLYELRSRTRGVDLIMRKTELWMVSNSQYPEAMEVRCVTGYIVEILRSSLLRDDPVEALRIVTPMVSRYMALTYVRKAFGAAGLRAFTSATMAQEEHPADAKDALAAAEAARVKQGKEKEYKEKKDKRAAKQYEGKRKRNGDKDYTDKRGNGAGSAGAASAGSGNGRGAVGAPEAD